MILLGVFIHRVIFSANNNFNCSFTILIPFISLSYLIALTETSNKILNRNGENGHPCPVLDHRGNTFNFSPLNVMLAMILLYMAFIVLGYVPSIPSTIFQEGNLIIPKKTLYVFTPTVPFIGISPENIRQMPLKYICTKLFFCNTIYNSKI